MIYNAGINHVNKENNGSIYNLINNYVFSSERINYSVAVIKKRTLNFVRGVTSVKRKEQFRKLARDYILLAEGVTKTKESEYNFDFFQGCIDAMIEINFRMLEFEKQYLESKRRKYAEKCFKEVRNNVSTFSGMKTVIFFIMMLIIISVTLLKTFIFYFDTIIKRNGVSNGIAEILGALFTFLICLIPVIVVWFTFITVLGRSLLKERVYRETQREMLLQILAIFISIFISILL